MEFIMTIMAQIDVREIPPRERHSRIFQSFDSLRPGEKIEITSDHEPRPLLAQFADTRPDTFEARFTESGPTVWKLEIERVKPKTCCGCGCSN